MGAFGPGRRRVVFLDLDGTLLTDDGVVPDSARCAVARARARGHVVWLSTGRSRVEIPDDVRAIGFDGVIAASGGHVQCADGRVLARRAVDPARASRAIDLLASLGVPYYLETDTAAFAGPGAAAALAARAPGGPDGTDAARPADGGFAAYAARMLPLADALPVEIDKITFLAAEAQLDRIRRGLAGRLTVAPSSVPWLGPGSGELTAPGVDKGWAARLVLRTLGASADAGVAFGDGVNDVELFRAVAVSVAMADAAPEARALATDVTESPWRDGIARGFARLGLTG